MPGPRVMYIELKTGYNDNGPARVGRVTFSKSGKSIYYGGKTFERIPGGGPAIHWRREAQGR